MSYVTSSWCFECYITVFGWHLFHHECSFINRIMLTHKLKQHHNAQKFSWYVRLWKQWCYIIIIIAVIIIINVCAKSLKSLFVMIKKVVVRVSLNINIFQTKFSWCLREKSKLPDSLWNHYRIAIWSRTLWLTSFSHKASPVCHLWFTGCVCHRNCWTH